jgi:environmental stress-induced protein Ves
MSYTFELIRKADQSTSNWSGGTTTQIAIFPKNTAYAERNFTWRISSARVELEESEFTSLPGIWRLIMVLDGEMRLEHTGHHTTYLKRFDQDSFSGDWTTKSFGKVRDFNVMLANNSTGKLSATSLASHESAAVEIHNFDPKQFPQMTSAFYCVDGSVTVTITNDVFELTAGDMLLITSGEPNKSLPVLITNNTNASTYIVRSDINFL